MCRRTNPGGVLFPPEDPEREAVQDYVYQSPRTFGVEANVWTLSLLRRHVPALQGLSCESSVFYRLKAWKIARKVGRLHIVSPDPLYDEKREAVRAALTEARQNPDTVRLLYADEFTYYRQPFLGRRWHSKGSRQPTSHWRGGGRKTKRRVVGALDAVSGRVVSRQASVMGIDGLVRFFGDIRAAYGPDLRLVVAWDNWPVHDHERVRAAAEKNGIALLYVPTYAPWKNPIEKLWKWLKDATLRFHTHADRDSWPDLWDKVQAFLDGFQNGSESLLAYCGLAFPV